MTASGDQSDAEIVTEYRMREHIYKGILSESLFSLKKLTGELEVKVHTVDGRLKTLSSFLDKVKRKGYSDPFVQTEDLVGVRVVTLFLSDLEAMGKIIYDAFDVISVEDKLSDFKENEFGYQSIHYIVQIKDEHKGPRYDELKGVKFEIQVRTILMDAWANVSHYLDYKGVASIPPKLKRSFFALSGLFYVADEQFGILHSASAEYESLPVGEEVLSPAFATSELTVNELYAYLVGRYPARAVKSFTKGDASEFLEEIIESGYQSISTLDSALNGTDKSLLEYEGSLHYANPGFFGPVGAARNSLAMVDKEYREKKYGEAKDMEKWIVN